MASTDAQTIPVKNKAYRLTFPIFDPDGDLVEGAAATAFISKDGAAFSEASSEATEISSSGMYYYDFSQADMNADTVTIIIKVADASLSAKTTPVVIYPHSDNDLLSSVTAAKIDDKSDYSLAASQVGVTIGTVNTIANWTNSGDLENVIWDADIVAGHGGDDTAGLVISQLTQRPVDFGNATGVHDFSILGQMASVSDTNTFDRNTDSLEALRNMAITLTGNMGTVNLVNTTTNWTTSGDLTSIIADAVWDENIVSAHGGADTSGLILSELTRRTVTFSNIANDSVIGQISTVANTSNYSRTTDSLEAAGDVSQLFQFTGNDVRATLDGEEVNLVASQPGVTIGTVTNWTNSGDLENVIWDADIVAGHGGDDTAGLVISQLTQRPVDFGNATGVHDFSILGQMASISDTSNFDRTTDSLESLGADSDAIKAQTDLFQFTGNDVRATLDGELVNLVASQPGVTIGTVNTVTNWTNSGDLENVIWDADIVAGHGGDDTAGLVISQLTQRPVDFGNATGVHDFSILGQMASISDTSNFDRTTDSLESIGSDSDAIKAQTDLFQFTGNDVRATLDGELVSLVASQPGVTIGTVTNWTNSGDLENVIWDADIVASHGNSDSSGLILSQLTKRTVTINTDVADDSIIGQILDNGTATYDRTTDSLQEINDSIAGGGGQDWTSGEREQIRRALGVAGTSAEVENFGITWSISTLSESIKSQTDQFQFTGNDVRATLDGELVSLVASQPGVTIGTVNTVTNWTNSGNLVNWTISEQDQIRRALGIAGTTAEVESFGINWSLSTLSEAIKAQTDLFLFTGNDVRATLDGEEVNLVDNQGTVTIGTVTNITNKTGFSLASDQSSVNIGSVDNPVTAHVVSITGDHTAAFNLSEDYNGNGYSKDASSIGTVTNWTNSGNITSILVDAVWDEDIVSAHGGADAAGLVLSQITKRAVTINTDVADDSVIGQILDNGTATYDRTTDSLQEINDSIAGGGGQDWTSGEREQIRRALGVAGASAEVENFGITWSISTLSESIKSQTDQLSFNAGDVISTLNGEEVNLVASQPGVTIGTVTNWTNSADLENVIWDADIVSGHGGDDTAGLVISQLTQRPVDFGNVTGVHDFSILGQMASITDTSNFDRATDSLEALGADSDAIKAQTDLFQFTGNDVRATLDGELVNLVASQPGVTIGTVTTITNKTGFSLAADQSGVNIGSVDNPVTAHVVSITGDHTAAFNLSEDYNGNGYNKDASSIGTVTNWTNSGNITSILVDAIWDEDIVASHGNTDSSGLILSELTKRSVTINTVVDNNSIMGQILDDGTATFDRTTDSLQSINDSIGGGGAQDWTSGERQQIRRALGVAGTSAEVESFGINWSLSTLSESIKSQTDQFQFTGNDVRVTLDGEEVNLVNDQSSVTIGTVNTVTDWTNSGNLVNWTTSEQDQIRRALGVAGTTAEVENFGINWSLSTISESIKGQTDQMSFNAGDIVATLNGEKVDLNDDQSSVTIGLVDVTTNWTSSGDLNITSDIDYGSISSAVWSAPVSAEFGNDTMGQTLTGNLDDVLSTKASQSSVNLMQSSINSIDNIVDDIKVDTGTISADVISTSADVVIIKKIETGAWYVVDNQLIIYETSSANPLFVFDLKDNAGLPTSTDPAHRIPV